MITEKKLSLSVINFNIKLKNRSNYNNSQHFIHLILILFNKFKVTLLQKIFVNYMTDAMRKFLSQFDIYKNNIFYTPVTITQDQH